MGQVVPTHTFTAMSTRIPRGSAGRAERERRRRIAIDLLARGYSQAEAARRLGVTREAVRQWKVAYERGGLDELSRPRVRRPYKVDEKKLRDLLERAARNPHRFGLEGRWTTSKIASLIERHLGTHYSVANVFVLLRRLGYRFVPGIGWKHTRKDDAPRKRGRAPWGYRRDDAGQLVPDDYEQRIMMVVRHMRVSGHTIAEIVDFLREQKLVGRGGRPIGQTRVFEMCHGGRSKHK